MKKLICFIAVMMLTVITASAQELDAHIIADEQTGSISVSGTGASYGGQLVSILIAEDEGGFYSPDSPLITEAVFSDSDGSFNITLLPADPLACGEYMVQAATADEIFQTSFIMVSLDAAKDLFESAGKCDDSKELGSLLATRMYDMGISEFYWNTYCEAITERMFEGIDDCKNANDFLKLCRGILATERIFSGEDIETVLSDSKNSMYVGDVTCYDMWESLSDEDKASVMEYYTDSSDPAFSFAQACVMTAVNSVNNWRELADVISPYKNKLFAQVLNLNTSYCTEKNEDSVMMLVYKKIGKADTLEDIRDIFYDVSKDYVQDKDSSKGSSGGSTGKSPGASSPLGNAVANAGEISFDNTTNVTSKTFTDIEGHWGSNYITKLAQSGYINGYDDGTFRPDAFVTRAEFVMMLSSCFNISSIGKTVDFADVDSSAWYADAVIGCALYGVIKGDENNFFNPDDKITREDASVMLYRLLNKQISFEKVTQIPFNDEAQISEYATDAVATMVDEGILSGFGNGYFRPLESTTRAQAVAMLVKSLDLLSVVG